MNSVAANATATTTKNRIKFNEKKIVIPKKSKTIDSVYFIQLRMNIKWLTEWIYIKILSFNDKKCSMTFNLITIGFLMANSHRIQWIQSTLLYTALKFVSRFQLSAWSQNTTLEILEPLMLHISEKQKKTGNQPINCVASLFIFIRHEIDW